MTDVVIPPWIIPDKESYEWLDDGSTNFTSAFVPGLTQTQSYGGGPRLKISRTHLVRLEERTQLEAILSKTKGKYRIVRTKLHVPFRGTFPTSELLVNNTFDNSLVNWIAQNSALAVFDRSLRIQPIDFAANPGAYQVNVAGAANAMYALRSAVYPNRVGVTVGNFLSNGSNSISTINGGGYSLCKMHTYSTGIMQFAYGGIMQTALDNRDYADVTWASMTRVPVVDNGPNLLINSEDLSNASWAKTAITVAANNGADPQGNVTADKLVPTAALSNHFVVSPAFAVAAGTQDYTFTVVCKGSGYNFAFVQLTDGVTDVYQYFNLATGALATSTSTGASWTNLRAKIQHLGSLYYACNITVTKTSSAVVIAAIVGVAQADTIAAFTGNASSGVLVWRPTAAISNAPTIPSLTTASTLPSGTSQIGGSLNVRNLPALSNALLLPNDMIEINGELKRVTAQLSSDGLGLGILQFEPDMFRSPLDGEPIIILNPMGKFLLSNVKIDNRFGLYSEVSYELEHIFEAF